MFTVSNPFVTKKSKIETIKNNTETKVKITCTTNALHYRKLLLGSFHEMAVSLVHIY